MKSTEISVSSFFYFDGLCIQLSLWMSLTSVGIRIGSSAKSLIFPSPSSIKNIMKLDEVKLWQFSAVTYNFVNIQKCPQIVFPK